MSLLPDWEPAAAAAVVGLVTYQLWGAWNKSAPSLAECRSVEPDTPDWITVKQRLLDADITVGTLALIIGVTISLFTKNITALVLILVIFGALSFYHHDILSGEQR